MADVDLKSNYLKRNYCDDYTEAQKIGKCM